MQKLVFFLDRIFPDLDQTKFSVFTFHVVLCSYKHSRFAHILGVTQMIHQAFSRVLMSFCPI